MESAGIPPSAVRIQDQIVSLEGANETGSVTQITLDERIFFNINSDQPHAAAVSVIKGLAAALAIDPAASMTVLGHTDATGTEEYNDTLSKERAENVIAMLVAFGAAPGQLSAVAIGARQPLYANDTEEGRARNRRVEFVVSDSLLANLKLVSQPPRGNFWPPAAVLRPSATGLLGRTNLRVGLATIIRDEPASEGPPETEPAANARNATGQIEPDAAVGQLSVKVAVPAGSPAQPNRWPPSATRQVPDGAPGLSGVVPAVIRVPPASEARPQLVHPEPVTKPAVNHPEPVVIRTPERDEVPYWPQR